MKTVISGIYTNFIITKYLMYLINSLFTLYLPMTETILHLRFDDFI